jgi:hypothetical protein
MRYMHVHGFIEEQVGGSESLERLVTKVQTLDAKGTLCSNYSRALGNVHYKINVKSPAKIWAWLRHMIAQHPCCTCTPTVNQGDVKWEVKGDRMRRQ